MKPTIRAIQPGDVEALATGLRACDRAEVLAATGRAPDVGTLQRCVDSSVLLWVATVESRLVCIFGVGALSVLTGLGSPWLLGTDLLDKHSRTLLRMCRRYVAEMLAVFPHLVNFVDARNTRSITWLRWLGFEIQQAEPFGAQGLPFHRFEMRA